MFIPFNDDFKPPTPKKPKKFKCTVESFTNNWCPPEKDIIHANFYNTKIFDCKDLLTGIKEMRENTSHFGDDDYFFVYSKTSPEMKEQEITFKFGKNCSMEVDQYQIEFESQPLKSWQLEAATDPDRTTWEPIDKQEELDLEAQQRYTFPIQHPLQKFYGIRLTMIGSNKAGRYYICLHYFNLHGNFYNEDKAASE
ncbi:hypothetical protein M9Y10_019788 [Tritrichomonas musculus]|uniref:Uncharacterized protein n=1 Tax=Tritrichomonas musculus TaxID=1915356 RepID=A0ABR2HHC7_9EUKA